MRILAPGGTDRRDYLHVMDLADAHLKGDLRKANDVRGWCERFEIEQMCGDAWQWQLNDPNSGRESTCA